ncbi:hypothetical protein LXL04_015262 [Taraxacum kok-saghyz]
MQSKLVDFALRGRIRSLAKDQNGCRLLQSKFENPTAEEIEIVLYDVLESIADLIKDQFGNYLVQKLIAVCNDDHKLRILLSLTDVPVQMIIVCMNPHGIILVRARGQRREQSDGIHDRLQDPDPDPDIEEEDALLKRRTSEIE